MPTDDDSLGMIMTEPYGVVGAITPWNFPISMAGWKLGPALAAGNAVVLKPSEMTPFSTLYLAELAVRAGLPAGLINVVLGDGQTTGNAITGHPDIAKVSFTGSTARRLRDHGQYRTHRHQTDDAGTRRQEPAARLRRCRSRPGGRRDRDQHPCQCRPGLRGRLAPHRRGRASPSALAEAILASMATIRPGPTWDETHRLFADHLRAADRPHRQHRPRHGRRRRANAWRGGKRLDGARLFLRADADRRRRRNVAGRDRRKSSARC